MVAFTDPPDFEMLEDTGSDGTYEFTVRASDGTNTGTWDYAVTVTDINERPELTGTPVSSETYDENQTSDVLSYTARDEEGPVTWSLTGTDSGDFDISGDVVTFVATPNFEDPDDANTNNVYMFAVVATDTQSGSNRLTAPIDVTVTVTDVSETPAVTGDTAPSFSENASTAVATYTAADPERDTLTWSVDGDGFWISDRGQLHFAAPPSFEDGNTTYQVTVTAADDGGLSDSLDVTVTVTDTEEAGTVAIAPPRGWDGTRLSAELADDDGNTSGITWQWARSRSRSSGWADISNATSSTYTAGADDVGHYLRATASYSDGRGSNKTASAALTGRIQEAGTRPASNAAPKFADAAATRSVGEGTAAGRAVGAPVTASDTAAGEVPTYTLSGPDADAFDIDAATGQLRTRAVLDRDAKDTHTVTVSVHDGFDATYNPSPTTDHTIEVTIVVSVSSRPLAPRGGGDGGGGGGGGGGRGPAPDKRGEFGDITGHQFVNEIRWIAEQGITAGCSQEPLRYCPNKPITRAQMASLLARALDVEAPRQPAGFTDVDASSVHGANIEALFAAEITTGCSQQPLRYCPDRVITRAQMSAFLYRARDLIDAARPA